MKPIAAALAAASFTLCWALPAAAQRPAPGLWEHSVTMTTDSGRMEAGMARMQQQLAAMPPEKRKQFEAMMAGQGMGLGAMGGGAGKPMVVKLCLTAEQAARDEMPQSDGNCKQVSQERKGNTLRFKFACGGERPSTGEGAYTFDNDKAHHGRTVISTTAQGKPERMEMTHQARWLSADCGAVQPRRSK